MILLEIFPVPRLDDGGEACRVWFIQSNKIIYPWIIYHVHLTPLNLDMRIDIVFIDEESVVTLQWMEKKTMHSINFPQHACVASNCSRGTTIF